VVTGFGAGSGGGINATGAAAGNGGIILEYFV
jgi:hypothetical protein